MGGVVVECEKNQTCHFFVTQAKMKKKRIIKSTEISMPPTTHMHA